MRSREPNKRNRKLIALSPTTSDSGRRPPLLSLRSSPGWRLITAFFFISYWLPMFGNILFADIITSDYRIYPLTPYCLWLMVGVYLLFCLLYTTRVRILRLPRLPDISRVVDWLGRCYMRFRLPFAVASIITAAVGVVRGLNNYRYSDQGISQTGGIELPLFLFLFLVFSVIITIDFFYCIFVRSSEAIPFLSRRYFENVMLATALLMSVSGSASTFLAFVCCWYSFFPASFRRFIFVPRHRSRIGKLSRAAISWAFLALVLFSAWNVGETIKSTGSDPHFSVETAEELAAERLLTKGPLRGYLGYLLENRSLHYYSLLFTASSPRRILDHGEVTPLIFPLRTFLFRLNYVMGSPFRVDRPALSSLMQLNYQLLIATTVHDREGSSPGFLGSFNYIFDFPWNVICSALYLRWFARVIDTLFSNHRSTVLSIPGLCLLVQFTSNVFASPFDFLQIVDDGPIYMILLIGIYVHSKSRAAEALPRIANGHPDRARFHAGRGTGMLPATAARRPCPII